MDAGTHLVCLEKGCRFLADLLPDRLCPNCGVEMVNEDRFLSRMRPKPTEELAALPTKAREASRDPANDLGEFVLVDVLGEGGSAIVHRAWQKKLRRFVAVKFLNSPNPETLRRFQCEAQLAAQLRHPNIVAVHEVGEVQGRHFLMMDYIDGFPIGLAKLSLHSIAEAFVKVCRAIEFAHKRRIIHRDLKPANILYENNSEPAVTDFGLARVLQDDVDVSQAMGIQGTPSYMSPEQARGKHDEIDERSDIYSLGATLYTLVTGSPPFDGENAAVILSRVGSREPVLPRKMKREVSPELEAIIMKALEKEKDLRYSTAEEMARDLERFLAGEPVQAPVRGTVDRAIRWVRQNSWPVISSLALALAATGILAREYFPSGETPSSGPGSPGKEEGEAWRSRFSFVTGNMAFLEFEKATPELVSECRQVISEVPEPNLGEVRTWFEKESRDLPKKAWPRNMWLGRKVEAKRLRDWCSTILLILRGLGPSFEPVRILCRDSRARFRPVVEHRGTISLRFLVWPYARLKSFRAGDRWMIRDGRVVAEELRLKGDSLFTPLEMKGVDIGNYTLVFSHPDLGERELSLAGEDLQNGKTYFCSGSLSDPDSISIRMVR